MSIDQPDKIDFLVTDKEKTFVLLIISDHLDGEEFDEGHHLELLQDKINAYLRFIESGQLIEAEPEANGLPIVIRVEAKYPLSREAEKFYRLAGPVVAEAGAALEFNVPSAQTPQRL